jgi:hypothetical protein
MRCASGGGEGHCHWRGNFRGLLLSKVARELNGRQGLGDENGWLGDAGYSEDAGG